MKKIKNYLFKNFEKVKINSKEIKKNDVFVALQGKNNHGNKYITQAIENGAKYVVTDSNINLKSFEAQILLVDSSINFLLDIAIQKRNLYSGVVIGITGSIGKTSVKENLKYFLSDLFKVSASIKSYNNKLGLIISIINLDLRSKYAIFEMGTNNFKEISYLTSLLKPEQAIITNIYPTHLEKLINTRNIAKEKSDIFNKHYNPKIKLVIIVNNNIDEKYVFKSALKQNISTISTVGKNLNSNLKIIKIIKIDKKYSNIMLSYNSKNIDIIISQNQIPRIENILICLLFFINNKINTNRFLTLAKDVPLIQGRGMNNKIYIDSKKINFINESYNASPKSMKVSIEYFNKIKTSLKQNKFLILGEMKELGKDAVNFHIEILKYISNIKIKNVIITGKLMKIALVKYQVKKILFMEDKEMIIKYIKLNIQNNDFLLIKGSNSSLTKKIADIFLWKEEK